MNAQPYPKYDIGTCLIFRYVREKRNSIGIITGYSWKPQYEEYEYTIKWHDVGYSGLYENGIRDSENIDIFHPVK